MSGGSRRDPLRDPARHGQIEKESEDGAEAGQREGGDGGDGRGPLRLGDGRRPREDVGPGEQAPRFGDHADGVGGIEGAGGERRQSLQVTRSHTLAGERPEEGGAAAEEVAGRMAVVLRIAGPVLEVVEDLEADADVPRVALERAGAGRSQTRQTDAQRQRHLERGRRLERVDLDRIGHGQRFVGGVAPPQLRPLPARETHVRFGEHRHQFAPASGLDPWKRGDDAVAESEQRVAGVDRDRNPHLFLERRAAVTPPVGILDVVVDQRRLVEHLHSHRRGAGCGVRGGRCRDGPAPVRDHGVVGREGDERPEELSPAAEIVGGEHRGRIERHRLPFAPGEGFRHPRLPDDAAERLGTEEAGRFAEERQMVGTFGRRVPRTAEESEHPLDVEWVLGLLGCAGDTSTEGADHLPLLREAAGLFRPEALGRVVGEAGVAEALAWREGKPVPLDSAAMLSADYLGRGGKFLRPFITLAAHDAVVADRGGPVPTPPASHAASRAAAVAVEVFHKASLIHDDIEDSDRRRYGRSTLQEEVGIPVAINTGDALLGLGYRIVSTLPGIEPGCRGELVAMLAEAHVRLSRGQGAELWWRDAADKSLSVADSIEIYALKTSPAFEVSLALGVRLAGLAPAGAGPLERYARHVGVGFQILNDLKDWAGDAENDRHAAGDLLGGRPTLLWALARERVAAGDLERLASLAAGALDPPDAVRVIAEARRLFSGADVFSRAAAIAEAERAAAIAAVAAFPLPRLRSVLGFLLDLAVPGGVAERIASAPA